MGYESVWLIYPVLVAAGFVAGVVNTIAGGGSFLTLPVLMYAGGLDAKLANGTNRVAILLSSAAATGVFHRHGHVDRRAAVRLLVPLLLGTPVGAQLAAHLPLDWFRVVFGVVFIGMAVFLCLNPRAMLKRDRQPIGSPPAAFAAYFAIGVYVGFIQAGYGLLMLVAMSLFHARTLVGANAIKNAIGFLITLAALVVFILHGQVAWLPGLVMAVGNVLGGIAGAHLAIRKGEKLIFAFLIVVMLATGAKMIYDTVA